MSHHNVDGEKEKQMPTYQIACFLCYVHQHQHTMVWLKVVK